MVGRDSEQANLRAGGITSVTTTHVPSFDHYPDGQTVSSPTAIDFAPGQLLGSERPSDGERGGGQAPVDPDVDLHIRSERIETHARGGTCW
jgi:hypothetical protein